MKNALPKSTVQTLTEPTPSVAWTYTGGGGGGGGCTSNSLCKKIHTDLISHVLLNFAMGNFAPCVW